MAQAHSENLKQAMDTLRAHKMRSALTVFGVVLGVSVIMLVAALITGFDQQIQENIKQFGADTAFISKWDQGFHGGDRPLEERQRKPLTLEDANALIEGCPISARSTPTPPPSPAVSSAKATTCTAKKSRCLAKMSRLCFSPTVKPSAKT